MLRILSGFTFPGAPAPELQLQPAGFDLTVRTIARLRGMGRLDLTNAGRVLPPYEDIAWEPLGNGHASAPAADLEWGARLVPGGYLVTYNEEIGVPADCAGLVLPRSSLMRCGATLHSALWDPGYCGRGQGLLSVFNELVLHRDARIGQFILIGLEQAADRLYEGRYQGENLAAAAESGAAFQ